MAVSLSDYTIKGKREPLVVVRDAHGQYAALEKATDVKVGDFVRWDSNGSVAQGKVERVVRDGKINVPDSSFEVKGEQDNPAVLIRIYKKFADGWKKTDTLVGHKASTLRSIQPLE